MSLLHYAYGLPRRYAPFQPRKIRPSAPGDANKQTSDMDAVDQQVRDAVPAHECIVIDWSDRELSDRRMCTTLTGSLPGEPGSTPLDLVLSGNDMEDMSAYRLSKAMQAGHCIRSLRCAWNLLGPEGAAALVPGVLASQRLRVCSTRNTSDGSAHQICR